MSRASHLTVLQARQPANGRRVRMRVSRWLLGGLLLLFLLAAGAAGIALYLVTAETPSAASVEWIEPALPVDISALNDAQLQRQLGNFERRNQRLEQEIARLAPRDIYVVIDTAHNRLYLKQDDQTLLEAVCSTGSGRILDHPNKKRTWIFDTPRGEFKVLGKLKDPVWRKPDWAFIEEGLPVPRREEDRMESGVLGDYGLAFGDGYFIHGTLYTRLLGRSVTHGCVRLGDKDLEFLFKNTPLWAKIYIF